MIVMAAIRAKGSSKDVGKQKSYENPGRQGYVSYARV
jgi:hypothetical protein